MVEDSGYTRIFPNCSDGGSTSRVQVGVRIGVNGELHDKLAVLDILRDLWGDVELLHGADKGFCAINDVFVNGMPVQTQFVYTVAILVDDLHLLDNSRLSALAGTYARGVSVDGADRLRGRQLTQ